MSERSNFKAATPVPLVSVSLEKEYWPHSALFYFLPHYSSAKGWRWWHLRNNASNAKNWEKRKESQPLTRYESFPAPFVFFFIFPTCNESNAGISYCRVRITASVCKMLWDGESTSQQKYKALLALLKCPKEALADLTLCTVGPQSGLPNISPVLAELCITYIA